MADPAVHAKAFDWQAAFPEVFSSGGFDVVVGNPPYVRQELLSPIKPYLQSAYRAYHGMADLYVYFYELGLRVLKPGGLLSFVVTNKWMKAGYGEPLRRFFAEHAWVESVVDFGHAKQIFEQADVFPSIIVARRPDDRARPTAVNVCAIPREQLRIEDLSTQIQSEGFQVEPSRLGAEAWGLESGGVTNLFHKFAERGTPLSEFSGVKPLYGVKTGLNEAFLIDAATRERLIAKDPRSQEIIKPYLRGQDIGRWQPNWQGLWMIFARRGIDIDAYPGVKDYLETFRTRLEPKPRDWTDDVWQGRKSGSYKWYELQDPVAYWKEFEKPKICIQRIAFHSRIALDQEGNFFLNDSAIILPTTDLWLLCCLNSPAMWCFAFRFFPHKKDEALAMDIPYVERLPIPVPGQMERETSHRDVGRLVAITRSLNMAISAMLDWLRVEYDIEKPTLKLQSPIDLDSDVFVAEVKKVRGKKKPLTAAGLKGLRDEYARSLDPARKLAAEAVNLEHEISDLVNAAYGLTPDEIALMWETAPPRMPITKPGVGKDI